MVFLNGLSGLDQELLHAFLHMAQHMIRSGERSNSFHTSPDSTVVAMGKLTTEFEKTSLGNSFGIRFQVDLTLLGRSMEERRLEFLIDERDAHGSTHPCGMLRKVPGEDFVRRRHSLS
ncbi:hypothetical protein KBD34_00235 [Patescibacteria group bacterium]|nr:hypothetical protein [Patescibacteria group bacterium]